MNFSRASLFLYFAIGAYLTLCSNGGEQAKSASTTESNPSSVFSELAALLGKPLLEPGVQRFIKEKELLLVEVKRECTAVGKSRATLRWKVFEVRRYAGLGYFVSVMAERFEDFEKEIPQFTDDAFKVSRLTVFLNHSDMTRKFGRYGGDLPDGLGSNLTPESVRELYRDPSMDTVNQNGTGILQYMGSDTYREIPYQFEFESGKLVQLHRLFVGGDSTIVPPTR